MKNLFCACLLAAFMALAASADTARGVVFNDINGNGILDAGEEGLAGVAVSNGRDVVLTDLEGRWELPSSDDTIFFVVKPTGWMTPVCEDNLPRFYYIHRPAGAPPHTPVPGVGPTGPLPESIDFPLRKQDEPTEFQVVLFGDTQVNDRAELSYVARDVVEELIGTDAAFGISLGDNVGDEPQWLEPLAQVVGTIGIPWHNIIGNHDGTPGAADNRTATDVFERIYGPATYAFEYGGVSFLILDNVFVEQRGRLDADKLAFIGNYLSHVPRERLVVMTMHIPWRRAVPEDLFEILSDRPHTFSVAAHTHEMYHLFIDESRGWKRPDPHHQFINGTVSGSWWCGLFDEVGIPHSTMNDGGPNGYAVATFSGTSYKIEYKAARRPANFQMNIYVPDEVASEETETTEVLVNVFAGSERSTVEMRAGGSDWIRLEQTRTIDPNCLRMHLDNVHNKDEALGYHFDPPSQTSHMWKGNLPALGVGAHIVEVRTIDMFGQTYTARRVVRVL